MRQRDQYNKKREFWGKVQEVRFEHRDRSKDQEVLGIRNEKSREVSLNKQMGFKSNLKIGKSNPSKKMHEPKTQRVEFDKHEDGSTCFQGDQMKFKKIIDLTEVKCQGFDKIIYVKKGWTPMVTRMTTIVCCPSTRVKLEKALVRKYDERQAARRRGAREKDLWSKCQVEHEREINQEWKHFDLIPGNHLSEETLESIIRQIEKVQIREQKIQYLTLPPVVLNDSRIHRLEKSIGESIWKLENGKYCIETKDIAGVIIPTSWQSSVKHCTNWVVLKVERKSGTIEIYDTRKEVESNAVLQKHIAQVSELASGIVGNDFKVSYLRAWWKRTKQETLKIVESWLS
ncbi:hypothetical protein OXYTRIMIC_388 [Oxytricha trifallax]|uniref:Ubiquitin-like protease family profile domain-containing protein n=1 Tax=Oxytricha trifallax TaxID=1172189 RepID=A0A073HXE0_9SPIT|nr:hypothetical protein OXYTRIMIC_388 [Oxytricha trifallax]